MPRAQTALVLHPDPALRDPDGVLTVRQVQQYRLWAEGLIRGHEHAREWSATPLRPITYAEVRDELLGLTDMPYTMACQIALWLTRDNVSMYFLNFTVVL